MLGQLVGSSLPYLRCMHYRIHPSSSVYVRPLGSSPAYFTASYAIWISFLLRRDKSNIGCRTDKSRYSKDISIGEEVALGVMASVFAHER
ncbi:hypothetical protein DVH24_005369 [Malus domestica]|uniref:Uncharacterized protein n=1 Tax=Malus domestica TaxID=3750 RepID=A0A498KJJ8_MALDO|nr:hypothetical protein DVH24_005369 [Malus domestica]